MGGQVTRKELFPPLDQAEKKVKVLVKNSSPSRSSIMGGQVTRKELFPPLDQAEKKVKVLVKNCSPL